MLGGNPDNSDYLKFEIPRAFAAYSCSHHLCFSKPSFHFLLLFFSL